MPKTHPLALRERILSHVQEGYSHRKTAEHFKVSIKSVNDLIILYKETGKLTPRPFDGRKGTGKLEPYKAWLKERITEKNDITLDELVLDLKDKFDLTVHRWTVCRMLHRLGLSHKKRQYLPKNNGDPI